MGSLSVYTKEQLVAEIKRREIEERAEAERQRKAREVTVICPACKDLPIRHTGGCHLCNGEGKLKAERV